MLSEIVDWVEQRPKSWQYAIDELIRNGNLSRASLDTMKSIFETENGLGANNHPSIDFISLRSFIQSTQTSSNVVLSKIQGIQNINALSPSSVLEFETVGLTAIYGDNGSGKSSYTSILKHVCNTRGKKPLINRSLFSIPPSTLSQQAQVEYLENNATSGTVTFTNNVVSEGTLKKVSVFDSSSAQHYIDTEDEIAFIPQGLSFIEKLAQGLKIVESEFENEKLALENRKLDFTLLQIEENTQAAMFVKSISDKTKRANLWNLCYWDASKDQRMIDLSEAIAGLKSTDPQKTIADNLSRIQRYTKLRNRLLNLENSLVKTEAIDEIYKVLEEYIAASDALKLSSDAAFSGLPYANVGGEAWKQLWESARKFYDGNQPGNTFADKQDLDNCPLCLQDLDEQAKKRFVSFEEFIKADTQKTFDAASKLLEELTIKLQNLEFLLTDFEPTISELEEANPAFGTNLVTYLKRLSDISTLHLANLGAKKTIARTDIEFAGENSREKLEEIIKAIEAENLHLKNQSIADELMPLEKELKELINVKKLHLAYPAIGREVYRLKKQKMLAACKTQCHSRTTTLLSNELALTHITLSLQEKLQEELGKLGFRNIKVQAGTRGEKGKQYHFLKLNEAQGNDIPLKQILSEGEHRCIALATFLSELALSDHSSGIIFDDPVSSLDHKWRTKIAKRIVEEAKTRQVIVFTHDITFLMMLEEQSELAGVPLTKKSLTRKLTETGIVTSNPPWDALSVKTRLGILKNDQVGLDKTERTGTDEEYQQQMPPLYGKLRETWERAIEEVVLHDVIKRFGREIQTKRLAKLIDLTQADYDIVDENMSKCSKFFIGHDNSGPLNEQLPDAKEFLVDVKVLENFVKAIRDRRK